MKEGGTVSLKAPFPFFGGKRKCAHLVWERFGDVPNYVEPFFGSGAVLLSRPHWPFTSTRIETVNDVDCYLVNFWRSMQRDPEAVCDAADCPIMEAELHARHNWLHQQKERIERHKVDPDFYDAKVAGYWVWGLSSWIGDCFCRPTPQAAIPQLGPSKGVNRKLSQQIPHLRTAGMGVNRKLSRLGFSQGIETARGVHKTIPDLGGGKGTERPALRTSDVFVEDAPGSCADRHTALLAYFQQLADRLRGVRVCCGDWTRVLTRTPTELLGLTGIFLDPPYDTGGTDYGMDISGISTAVREWCKANGDNPLFRIALCGYVDEKHGEDLPSWTCVKWKAGGGYNNQGNGENQGKNRERERIWFSPNCHDPNRLKMSLF